MFGPNNMAVSRAESTSAAEAALNVRHLAVRLEAAPFQSKVEIGVFPKIFSRAVTLVRHGAGVRGSLTPHPPLFSYH